MKTMIPQAEYRPDLSEVRRRVMAVITQQPGVPFSIDLLAEMLGILPRFIEAAFSDFVEPDESLRVPRPLLHVSAQSKQVIYLP